MMKAVLSAAVLLAALCGRGAVTNAPAKSAAAPAADPYVLYAASVEEKINAVREDMQKDGYALFTNMVDAAAFEKMSCAEQMAVRARCDAAFDEKVMPKYVGKYAALAAEIRRMMATAPESARGILKDKAEGLEQSVKYHQDQEAARARARAAAAPASKKEPIKEKHS